MSTMTSFRGNVGHHLAGVLKNPRYDWGHRTSSNPNVAISYRAQLGDATITIDCFRGIASFAETGWATVQIAFGEVRESGNCTLASGGVVHASSSYREPGTTPVGGSALPGYDLIGLKWRVSGVAPESRTHVSAIGDGYVQTENIVEYLLSLRAVVGAAKRSHDDLSSWDGEGICPVCGLPAGDGFPCPECSDEDGEHTPADDGIAGARQDNDDLVRTMSVLVDYLADLAEEDKDIRAEVLRRAGLYESDRSWEIINAVTTEFREVVTRTLGRKKS